MARNKKYVKKQHKNSSVTKSTAVIYEIDNSKKKPLFNVKHVADDRGWYEKLVLTASKDPSTCWTEGSQGKDKVIIESFDLGLEITLPANNHRKTDVKLSLEYYELCDLVTAFQTMDYFYKKKTGRSGKTPVSIGKVKRSRVK